MLLLLPNQPRYRTSDVLAEGVPKVQAIVKEVADLHIVDKTLIWNTDLIETLELQNLVFQGLATLKCVVVVTVVVVVVVVVFVVVAVLASSAGCCAESE